MASLGSKIASRSAALNFLRTPIDISKTVSTIISREKEIQDKVASQVSPTFHNTVVPLASFQNEHGAEEAIVTFLQNVSTDKEVRDASTVAEEKLSAFRIESMMREDVYRAIRAVRDNKEGLSKLEPEDRKLIEEFELKYRRNGLALSQDQREKLGSIRKRLSELSIRFARNINEGDARALFTREELEGLPVDFFEGRATEVEDGVEKYVVTTKYPDLIPTMQLAKREDTRKRLLVISESRCPENIPLLEEAIKLRLEAAKLLGYSTHAEFVLERNMAKNPDNVIAFQTDLLGRLNALADKEIEVIENLKKADCKAAGVEYNGLYNWDYRYYSNLVKERDNNISDEEVKQYFPMKEVTRGILNFYQNMLKLHFTKVENPVVWHPDVDMYEVRETDGDELVGYFYLDLYPREGKYNHACVNPIRDGFEFSDGTREYPAAVMLANFPKPTASAPALLKHDDFITLLHEMGHVFHHICTKTKWSFFNLGSVQTDFIEAPSQMLENWGWDPSTLRKFAVHYKTGEPIPEELVKRLVASKNSGAGLFNLRQLFFGLFDMAIHNTTDANISINDIYRQMRTDIGRFSDGSLDTCGAATFGHMMGGYDAGYYGYLWAKVFSSDMYKSKFLGSPASNAQAGLDYRREILRPGGSRDASLSLERFLGRSPNNIAFLESIGLSNQ